jgi:PAS domain S-box-containing protein
MKLWWVSWGMAGLQLCATESRAQDVPAGTAIATPVLTNALQVLARSPRDRAYTLQITGTVTFYDPAQPILFVEDGTAALSIPVRLAPAWRVATSNRVTLQATIDANGRIKVSAANVLETEGPWPPPTSVSVPELESGRHDAHYVRMQGVLRSAIKLPQHFVLRLQGDTNRSFQVMYPLRLVPRAVLDSWVDAELEVRGVCGSALDEQGKPAGYQLWLPGPEHVSVLKPPALELISSNAMTIAAAKVFDVDRHQVGRQLISGVVTWVENDREFYLQDETAGADAQLLQPVALKPGQRVLVAGLPLGDVYSYWLNHAVVRVLTEDTVPLAVGQSPQKIMDGDYWSMLVKVSGYVLDGTTNRDEIMWNIRGQSRVFTASLELAQVGDLAGRLQPGTYAQFTGICMPVRDQHRMVRTFQVNARTPADIKILAGATWATIRQALPFVGGALALAALAVGWALFLRYQVRRQTRQIREQLVRTTALEERFRELFENASDLVFTCDWSGQITQVNQTVERLTGYRREEALKMSVLQWVAPEDEARLREALQQQRAGKSQVVVPVGLMARNGHRLHLELSACPLYRDGQAVEVLAIARDTTERRNLEEQLRQSQKMEAVGQLAGGVAHDFNNILTAVLLQLGILQGEDSLAPELREGLAEIESSAKRAATLTRQLLMFSRRQVLQSQTLDLNALLGNLLKMLRRLIGEQITLEFNSAPGDLWIRGDPGLLEQVVVNLVVNARDAMPKGGRITLATQAVKLEAPDCARNAEARPGDFICLRVADTGYGMDAATQERIFEPFFTTKGVGKGTGLGLATAYGIVKQHNGWIEVNSSLGQGSAFRVFLPGTAVPESAKHDSAAQPPLPQGHETILLVEDAEDVRHTLGLMLRRFGYRVVEAGNSEEALALWPQERERIALLLTDMVMPGHLNGQELLRKLRLDKPSLKCVLMSGYSRELVDEGLSVQAETTFLSKPFEPAVLAEQIRHCMDQAG